MRFMLLTTAAAAALSLATPVQSQTRGEDDRTKPGTTLGTGPASGSEDHAVKPVPGPGMTTGDSSEGRSGSAPSLPADQSTGPAPPNATDRAPDMTQVPKAPPHGGSSASGIGGGAVAPGRSSGEDAPTGRQ